MLLSNSPASPPPSVRSALFGGAATEKRVREELMNYSDFSLHAFCYNAGPDFASFRLNQSHMMASTKFRFLAKLLKEVRAGRGGAAAVRWVAEQRWAVSLVTPLRICRLGCKSIHSCAPPNRILCLPPCSSRRRGRGH